MKARTVFDTPAYANRLKAAGLDTKIAETQAEANADMVANLLDSGLVSQESFQLGLTRLENKIQNVETRLDAKIQKLERRIEDLETRIDVKLQELETRFDAKLQLTRSDLTQQMIRLESNLRQDMKDLETRLTLRLGGIMVGSIGITATLLSLLHILH